VGKRSQFSNSLAICVLQTARQLIESRIEHAARRVGILKGWRGAHMINAFDHTN
jgi:hypothetical protein